VTVAFLLIAAGQLAGAPATGALADATSLTTSFVACAALGVVGACVRPRS
jgi:hypothetical protein